VKLSVQEDMQGSGRGMFEVLSWNLSVSTSDSHRYTESLLSTVNTSLATETFRGGTC
jgi:hypothetical protein